MTSSVNVYSTIIIDTYSNGGGLEIHDKQYSTIILDNVALGGL